MGKRAWKNKKRRFVAIGSALATGAAVIVLLPSAHAAKAKTTEEIMVMCKQTKKLNGKPQSIYDWGGHPLVHKWESDSCDLVETNFETFDGPTQKASIDFPNCEPDATEPAKASITWKSFVSQGKGMYEFTQHGAAGGLFGALNGSWVKHNGTFDLTVDQVIAGDTETREVPVGKVLYMEFTPKMQRMTTEWRVRKGKEHFSVPEVIEGPVALPGLSGAAGIPDGVSKAVVTDC